MCSNFSLPQIIWQLVTSVASQGHAQGFRPDRRTGRPGIYILTDTLRYSDAGGLREQSERCLAKAWVPVKAKSRCIISSAFDGDATVTEGLQRARYCAGHFLKTSLLTLNDIIHI